MSAAVPLRPPRPFPAYRGEVLDAAGRRVRLKSQKGNPILSIYSKVLSAAAVVTLTGGLALTAGAAHAANTPLPAYPATTTLNLGSPNCVTDDVIMNDPLDSTSPITDTYGSAAAVVLSQATPPVTYYLWYLNTVQRVGPGPSSGYADQPDHRRDLGLQRDLEHAYVPLRTGEITGAAASNRLSHVYGARSRQGCGRRGRH